MEGSAEKKKNKEFSQQMPGTWVLRAECVRSCQMRLACDMRSYFLWWQETVGGADNSCEGPVSFIPLMPSAANCRYSQNPVSPLPNLPGWRIWFPVLSSPVPYLIAFESRNRSKTFQYFILTLFHSFISPFFPFILPRDTILTTDTVVIACFLSIWNHIIPLMWVKYFTNGVLLK